MKVQNITLLPSDTFHYNGFQTFEVQLGDKHDLTVLDVSTLLDETILQYQMRMPLVTIDATVPGEQDPNDILELVSALVSKKYIVIGKSPGYVYPRWLPACNHKVAWVTNDPWIGYGVNEIQYCPPNEGPLKEPLVLEANMQSAKTLLVQKKWPAGVIYAFLHAAHATWSVRSIPQYGYGITIL